MFSNVRRGGARLVLLVGIFLIGMACSLWIWFRPAAQPSVEKGRSVAEEFLKQIREGHPEQAWESTTSEFKSDHGCETFIKSVKPLPFLKEPLTFASVQTVELGDHPYREFCFRSSDHKMVSMLIAREEGVWKVARLTM